MKKFLKMVFIFTFILALTNCEKDDICDPTLATTPRLIIEFYSDINPSVTRPVTDLTVKAPEVTTAMFFSGVSKIELPLKTFENSSSFVFTINSNATDGTMNEDTVHFNYTTQDIYVSRGCGFKTFYDLSQTSGIVTDADNWIKDKTIVITKIESENDVHIKLFF